MSLIQDALKRKAEEQPPEPVIEAPAPAQTPPPAPEPLADNPPRKLVIILVVAVVLILLLVGAGIFFAVKFKPAEEPPAFNADVVTEKVEEEAPPAPLKVEQPKPAVPEVKKEAEWPELNFSGVAAGDGQRLAMINGRMISAGKKINGVTVLQIGRDEVLVEHQGRKKILRTE